MKRMIYLLFICSINTGCFAVKDTKKKITFHITDQETSKVVTNATVKIYNKGWHQKKVDSNGFCTFTGEGISFGWTGHTKAFGYYNDSSGLEFEKRNKILNRWEPWNPTLEVKLRPIKNLVPMVHKKIFRLPPPKTNSSVGFDLEVGDWVAPYGKGKVSDFVFTVTLVLTPKKGAQYKLTFANPNDGIQEYESSKEIHSYFKWPYLAPLSKYKTSLERFAYYMFPNPRIPSTNLKKNVNYIFRVRSKVDKKGNLISAYYGYIKGEIQIEKENAFYFEYWLNTNSTSRSLEWIGNVPHDQQKNYK